MNIVFCFGPRLELSWQAGPSWTIKLIWSSLPLFRNVRCFFISDSSWSSLLSPLGKYWKHSPSYNLFHFLNYLPGITRRTIIYKKSVGNFLQCVKAINLLKVKNVHYWLPSSYQPFFNSSIRKPVFWSHWLGNLSHLKQNCRSHSQHNVKHSREWLVLATFWEFCNSAL